MNDLTVGPWAPLAWLLLLLHGLVPGVPPCAGTGPVHLRLLCHLCWKSRSPPAECGESVP